ncbi:hypothetical protein OLMES_3943 [Oleiphilus messinensis]|uniref:Uncharacterized protein n=1 Tax=Oleiphilus messinensis TaxID=141451 RepID=A0A1Y0IBP2_9GAMM|nr:hypothetical protein [Oleiphilus messinensis]ARU57962.1 hypothetical protein OLMES_3943 [Oleiphilus messinensis]
MNRNSNAPCDDVDAVLKEFIVGVPIIGNHRTYDQLFSMLLKGRVDIALGMQREVYRFVEQQPEFRVMKMHRTPMLRVPLPKK